MASLIIFHHDPRRTFAHEVDPRIKILIMISLAWASIFAPPRGFLVLFMTLLLSAAAGKIPLRPLLKNGLPIWILAAVLFISRAAGTPGIPLMSAYGIDVSLEGIISGALAAGRLVFLVLLSHGFISLTSLSDIQRALNSLLSPLPYPIGPRTALLAGLSINMIPGLLDTAGEILEAAACRGLVARRKPFRFLAIITVLFMRKAVRRSGETAEALEARNYRYDRAWRPLKHTRKDFTVLAVSFLVIGGVFLI